MNRIVIIGAGFGGLRAAKTLRNTGLDVLLIDRQNYHLFQPLLYQVATASIEQEAIAYPIRAIIRSWDGVRFRMAEVTDLDLDRRRVITEDGAVDYDMLIVAAGAATNFFGIPSIEQHAHELKSLQDAVDLRNRVLSLFEQATLVMTDAERRALLTFVVVGGGPTGVEFAGALAELVRNVLGKDHTEEIVGAARIVLVEMLDTVLTPYERDLREYAVERLEHLGVEVRLGAAVEAMDGTRVYLSDGNVIPSHTLLWMAGVQAASITRAIPVDKERGGRVPVDEYLRLVDYPDVYIVGDMAYVEDEADNPLPQMAPIAIQQGEYAAKNILAHQTGEIAAAFAYNDKGKMAVIGRGHAVAHALGLKLRGVIAWLAWLALHLMMLIDFRNRLVVLVNWAYDYLLFERKVRLITGHNVGSLPGTTVEAAPSDERLPAVDVMDIST
ncbi:MAG: NAD(P)/FAD-dependent oxidoreductase [Anaerolineae bacterium]|nr:NAD(P)/FAD-dependent oxidoreductase [Anaerolineae bacterium]